MPPKLAALLLVVFPLAAAVHVENRFGRIDVRVAQGAESVEYKASSPTRAPRSNDVRYYTTSQRLTIVVTPPDGARIDLEVTVPHTAAIEVSTVDGEISVSGLLASVDLVTDTGSLRISAPWEVTRLRMASKTAPRQLVKPKVTGVDFTSGKREQSWVLANARPDLRARYGNPIGSGWFAPWDRRFGSVRIAASAPGIVELTEQPLTADSWIRVPRDAVPLLKDLRGPVAKSRTAATPVPEKPLASAKPASEFVFRSDVRLVTLSVPVYDRDGHPVTGLKPDDFELLEDGKPQQIAFASSGENPFNLVLLLDLSTSASVTRPLMKKAAEDFAAIAQPQDRVAVHVLSNSLFRVVSPLTAERKRLLTLIGEIPEVAGGSPIYDSIVLSYARETLDRPGERSAMVVLTDGMDNQLELPGHGSQVPFERLRAAAAEWPVPIYTILFPYASEVTQARGRYNMQQLADASGGRLFDAASVAELAPVYAQVEQELRSVYQIGYYPANQDFNGHWRNVSLRVKQPGLSLRTRPGYYAW